MEGAKGLRQGPSLPLIHHPLFFLPSNDNVDFRSAYITAIRRALFNLDHGECALPGHVELGDVDDARAGAGARGARKAQDEQERAQRPQHHQGQGNLPPRRNDPSQH